MIRVIRISVFLLVSSMLIAACSKEEVEESNESEGLSINFEKITLDNGLEVVFHQDHSDPVVAVALTFHVGSAREKPGKTGFAHLFEHLFFLESENLGKGGLDKMSSRIGGSGANGSTSRDRTNYFQTVPKDALEKMIWAEADKVGYFINTVTDEVLTKEKQVVKNEKRQSYDNRPYGHTNYVITKNLYPDGHPYSWEVIGTLEDLQQLTLADVKEFHKKYYGPNNATLVIAGDFDMENAKALVHKYFDEIPSGEPVESLAVMPIELPETRKLYHEDNFARLPELNMVWPAVEMYHPDSYALGILSELLTTGKDAPFYKVLVEEKQLTSDVSMYDYTSEIAGEMRLEVRAYPGVDLDTVEAAVLEAFQRFESDGFDAADLDRIKAGIETSYYNGLSSVLGKAFQLAQYNIFAGDPGFINQDIKKTLAVTAEDVRRVYQKYLKGQHYVAISFVPKGTANLAVSESGLAQVIEEQIVDNGEGETFETPGESDYERTASSFDRTVEPPYGESAEVVVPEVWQTELSNGMKVLGIESDELPLVQFVIDIRGGMLLEDPSRTGVSNMLAEMLSKGTAEKTPLELEQAIDALGARINIYASDQHISVSGTTLSRNYAATMELVEEMLMEPRWDSTEFVLTKQEILSQIEQSKGNPNAIAGEVFRRLIYRDNILSNNSSGTLQSVQEMTIDDLKNYYERFFAPNLASMHVVGSLGQDEIVAQLDGIQQAWIPKDVSFPEAVEASQPASSKVYFYDMPGAKQSVLNFGYLAMPETDHDYYPATVMNYILGGGGFASRFTQELREGKGYTYGIGSGFQGNALPGPFRIFSGVRTNVTYESSALVKEILEEYPATFSEEDLENTKSYFLKSNARAFETAGAKLNMLQKLSEYGWDPSFIKDREQTVKDISIEEIRELARKYANPNSMYYVIVGDAATQMEAMKNLGFGDPVLIRDLESIPLGEMQ